MFRKVRSVDGVHLPKFVLLLLCQRPFPDEALHQFTDDVGGIRTAAAVAAGVDDAFVVVAFGQNAKSRENRVFTGLEFRIMGEEILENGVVFHGRKNFDKR